MALAAGLGAVNDDADAVGRRTRVSFLTTDKEPRSLALAASNAARHGVVHGPDVEIGFGKRSRPSRYPNITC